MLVLWIGGVEPEAVVAQLARIGVTGCVHPAVVDDGILDVHVEVSSRAEARRVERALALAGLAVERSWTFGGAVPVGAAV